MVHFSLYNQKTEVLGEAILITDKNADLNMNPYKEDVYPAYLKFPVIEGPEDKCPFTLSEYEEVVFWGVLTVKDYLDWFNIYRPDLNAGWFSSYNKWLLDRGLLENPEDYACRIAPDSTYVFTEYPIGNSQEALIAKYLTTNFNEDEYENISFMYVITERKEKNA